MKTLICAAAVLVLFPLQSVFGASPEEETNFLVAVRQAYDKQDTNALFTLICWDRVPDKLIQRAKNISIREIACKVYDMTLVNFLPDKHYMAWKDTNGVDYLPNLPVILNLKIAFVVDGHAQSVSHPIGEKDGKLYLLENAPVESQMNSAAEESFKKESAFRVTQAREWAATCTIFAEDNQNLLPTNFDQINYFFPSLSPTSSTNWEIASGGNLNSFTNPHQNMLTILLREKESRQSPDGTFVKAYAFVDGHVQQLSSSNNDFTAMEKQRGFLVKPGKNVRE